MKQKQKQRKYTEQKKGNKTHKKTEGRKITIKCRKRPKITTGENPAPGVWSPP